MVNNMTSTVINSSIADVRAELLRDFVFEALAPVEHDAAAARLCLRSNDDAGAKYHLKRAVAHMKAATASFNELTALAANGRAV